MNERIEKLAKDHLVQCEHTEFGWQECYRYEFEPNELQDFVGLIVRECMKVADEGMAQVTMKVEWPSYHIKKHFEVE